jgi:cytochrome o ubiquinol oxidase subunit 2
MIKLVRLLSENKILKVILTLITFLLLVSCKKGVFEPEGYIAASQQKLMIISFLVMIAVAIPVFIMAFIFAYKYSEKNPNSSKTYDPTFNHSTTLEIVWWGIPIVIVIFLSILTWITSHTLDPKKRLDLDISQGKQAIIIEAVALDWKWLFIYPEQGIATINYIQVPENTEIIFKITADAPMNGLWIPQLGGMIYAMAGMETNLHLIANKQGIYAGSSSNYSGFGFSGMKFNTVVVDDASFNDWVKTVKASNNPLTNNIYGELEKQTMNEPVKLYSSVPNNLFSNILNKYMAHIKVSHNTH